MHNMERTRTWRVSWLANGSVGRHELATRGGVAEWLKAHAWKACLRETVTWVRIPLPPPPSRRERLSVAILSREIARNCSILRPTSAPWNAASSQIRSLERRFLWSSVLSLGSTVSGCPLKQVFFEASTDVEFEINSLDRGGLRFS
jgi:hypothetical protein